MNRKQFNACEEPYVILRANNIPASVTLQQMLKCLTLVSRRIIGVFRTADYKAKRLGHTVYFWCTTKNEAALLEAAEYYFVGDGRAAQRLYLVDSIAGCATIPNIEFANAYEGIPVSVHVTGLKRMYYTESFTEYLIGMLPHFELQGDVTGFRLNFDRVVGRTKSDGFVTFLNQRSAREFGGERKPTIHLLKGHEIGAQLSWNVPLLLPSYFTYSMQKGKAVYHREVAEENQLVIQHSHPFIHPRGGDDNLNVGDPLLMPEEVTAGEQPRFRSPIRAPRTLSPQPSTSKRALSPRPYTSKSTVVQQSAKYCKLSTSKTAESSRKTKAPVSHAKKKPKRADANKPRASNLKTERQVFVFPAFDSESPKVNTLAKGDKERDTDEEDRLVIDTDDSLDD